MSLDCSLEYLINDDATSHLGQIKNLSSKGVLFMGDKPLALGSQLQITITPVSDITPPMIADVSVIRCDKQDDGNYYVAVEIAQIK